MGYSSNGQYLGGLHIHEHRFSSKLDSPSCLKRYVNGLIVNLASNAVGGVYVRQLSSPTTGFVADVVILTPKSWALRFYHTKGPLVSGLYDQSALTPYQTTTFESIYAADGTTYEKFVATDSGEVSNRRHEYRWNVPGAENAWSLVQFDGGLQTRQEDLAKITDSDTQRREIRSIRDASGQLFSQVETTFTKFDWGYDKTQEATRGLSPTGALTGDDEVSTWSYFTADDPATGALKSRLREETIPTGNWTQYTYTTDGRVAKKRQPHLNSAPTAADSACRVTEYTYLAQNLGGDTGNELITIKTEKLLGQVTARTFDLWWSGTKSTPPFPGSYREHWIINSTDLAITDPATALAASTSLITKERHDYYSHRHLSTQRPDGTLTITEISGGTTTVRSGAADAAGNTVTSGTKTVTTVNAQGGFATEVVSDIATNLTLASRTATASDAFGRPTAFTYLDGSTTSQTYDCCGISSETDRNGIQTSYTRDSSGRVLTQTRAGITTRYTYDVLGRTLTTERLGSDASVQLLATNTYDCCHLVSTTDAASRLTTYAETTNPTTGQTIRTTTYPGGATRIETTNRDGSLASVSGTAVAPVTYEYGVEPTGETFTKEIRLGSAGETTEWTKTTTDALGRTTSVTSAPSTYHPSPITSYSYNSLGQLACTIDPDGVATLYAYNPRGELEVTAVDLNRNNTIDYAGTDRLTRTRRTIATAYGTTVARTTTEIWETDSADTPRTISTTETSIDGLHTWTTTNGLLTTTDTTYPGPAARVETTTTPDGTQSIRQYASDRLATSTVLHPTLGTLASETYAYDPHGRLSTSSRLSAPTNDPSPITYNLITTYTYHPDDRLASVTTPDPDTTRSGPGYDPQITTYAYDSAGRLSTTTLPDNTTTTQTYQPTGQVAQISGSRTYPQAYTYDSQGRLKTLTTWQNFANATGAATTTWNYDPATGRLLNKRYTDNTGPAYTYTPAGRLLTRTWARGTLTTYAYNNAGDLSGIDYADTTPDVAQTYDRLGRPLTTTDAAGTLTRAYHPSGQLASETYSAASYIPNHTLTRTYDPLNRLNSYTYNPSPITHNLTYDAASRLASVTSGTHSHTYAYQANTGQIATLTQKQATTTRLTTTKTYDALNRLTTSASVPSVSSVVQSSYTYNSANQRTRLTREDNTAWAYTYDPLGQLTTALKKSAADQPLLGYNHAYAYDDIGNRVTTTTNTQTSTYTANPLNQYTSRTLPAALDLLGTAATDATVTVTTAGAITPTQRQGDLWYQQLPVNNSSTAQDVSLKVTAVKNNVGPNGEDLVAEQTKTALVPQTPESYTYDLDGNLLTDARWLYTWDAENRLIALETNPALVAPTGPLTQRQKLTFTYDAQGRRLDKKVFTSAPTPIAYNLQSATRFSYDAWNLLAEVGTSGSLVRSYTWGLDLSNTLQGAGGVSGLLSVTTHNPSPITYYPAFDANGNLLTLTNAADGLESARYEYDPYGQVLQSTGPAAALNPFGFSTKYTDPETNLCYYGFRFYNPSTGRWPSRDPIEEEGGINLYAFVFNNPLNYVDSDGRQAISSLNTQTGLELALFEKGIAGTGAVVIATQTVGSNPTTTTTISPPTTTAPTTSATKAQPNTQSTTKTQAIPLSPPGDCKQQEYDSLNQAVKDAKSKVGSLGSCEQCDSCPILFAKFRAWRALAVARSQLNKRCFRGGDPGHQQANADAWTNVAKCSSILKVNKCTQ